MEHFRDFQLCFCFIACDCATLDLLQYCQKPVVVFYYREDDIIKKINTNKTTAHKLLTDNVCD